MLRVMEVYIMSIEYYEEFSLLEDVLWLNLGVSMSNSYVFCFIVGMLEFLYSE